MCGDTMKILIIEDHKKINDLLSLYLKQEHHDVLQAFNGKEALLLFDSHKIDLVITDLMLPDIQGEDLIKHMRTTGNTYIICLSAKTDVTHKIDVFSLGADDYMTKPFSVDEVIAKLKNIEKRLKQYLQKPLSYNQQKLIIYPAELKVLYNLKPIELTHYELKILIHLSSNPHRIYSRDDLMMSLFDQSEAYDRVIDAFIKNIRKKLNDHARNPLFIKTHYGLGYQFIGVKDDEL